MRNDVCKNIKHSPKHMHFISLVLDLHDLETFVLQNAQQITEFRDDFYKCMKCIDVGGI